MNLQTQIDSLTHHQTLLSAPALTMPPAENRWADPYPAMARILVHYHKRLIVLGLLLGVLGAVGGRQLGRRQFRSDGLVRIPFVHPGIDPRDPAAVAQDLFEAFVQSQRAVITSRRIADLAVQQPAWIALGPITPPAAAQNLSEHLTVEHTPHTDYLVIAYTDKKPAVAAAAVQSVIAAYAQIFDQQNHDYLQQQLQSLEARQKDLAAKLEEIDAQIAAAAGSAGTISADRLYDAAVQRVINLETSLAQVQTAMAKTAGQGGWGVKNEINTDSLQTQEMALTRLIMESRHEMMELGLKRLEMDRLRAAKDPIEKQWEEAHQRMESLQAGAGDGGRLTVVSAGEIPLEPFQDRQWPATIAGGAAGALLPAALFVLLGLISTRYKFWGDAEAALSREAPFLGVLPNITRDTDEGGVAAARCLHQIRVMLQTNHPPRPKRATIFLVSSCSEGEGKTSLAAALAISFAASGSRTLLMDCDLVAQSLSRRFDCRGHSGLKEALVGDNLQGHCTPLSIGNLWLLPVGHSHANDASALAGERLDLLLEQARGMFDAVIIDSGPILGSVEATTLAPKVDGVVFTVMRDQKRSLIDLSMRKLRSAHAVVAGVVFNRAKTTDFQRSSYYSNYSAAPKDDSSPAKRLPAPATKNKPAERFPAFGPLVGAIALSLPQSDPDSSL